MNNHPASLKNAPGAFRFEAIDRPASPGSPVRRLFVGADDAFTLIELLVTIAVIAVLVAIALPVFNAARDRAATVECTGNLRQIGVTMFSYTNDHNGRTPIAGTSPWSQEYTWAYQLWPYAYGDYKNFQYYDNTITMQQAATAHWQKNIFRCPSTKKMAIWIPTATLQNPSYSYGFNSDAGGIQGGYNRNVAIPLTNIQNRAKAAMVTETSQSTGDYQGYYTQYGLMPHYGGSNVLFYDGHAEWRKASDFPNSATDTFWTGRTTN